MSSCQTTESLSMSLSHVFCVCVRSFKLGEKSPGMQVCISSKRQKPAGKNP